MAVIYPDQEIESLLRERKPLPSNWRSRARLQARRGNSERHLDLTGDAGSEFRLILKQNTINQFNFSIILAVRVPQSNQLFRLRRCNGRSHEHTNRIEGVTFYDFHIHFATERYQAFGAREDAYAEPTDRYSDFHGALQCMIADANFEIPPDPQGHLFGEV